MFRNERTHTARMKRNEPLKIRRVFVDWEALLRGERIERTEEELTPEEFAEFKRRFTDRILTSLGYVKEDKVSTV